MSGRAQEGEVGNVFSEEEEDDEEEEEEDGEPNLGFNLLFGNLGNDNQVEADWLDEVVLAAIAATPDGGQRPFKCLTPYGYRMLGKRSKGLAETPTWRGLRYGWGSFLSPTCKVA